MLTSGSLFANRFEIDRAAGSGGMGTVYRARDRFSGDFVALKLLHGSTVGPDDMERFAREAQLLAELRHPGIVSHIAHGQTAEGLRFLAMEWLTGEDLGQRLLRGPLPLGQCIKLLQAVSAALAMAHQRSIVHRDLKPSNLFLLDGELAQVKILDFGIARRLTADHDLTRTGLVIGTPDYMAPEQARGSRDLRPAADLFALGCVLYECLTGKPPFAADHIAAVLVRILFEEPTPVDERRSGVPEPVVRLLARLLAKDPAQRPADAAMLRAELETLSEVEEPVPAATLAGPRAVMVAFADSEQSLFSIVLAAPPESPGEVELQPTISGSATWLEDAQRQALRQQLVALGTFPEFLATGALIVTVPLLPSAQDQATLAARAALLIKASWPAAVVSLATGRGAVKGRTPVGEVVDNAARILRAGSHTSLAVSCSGIFVDPLSAKLLAGRFAQTPQPGGAVLLTEEKELDASRPLLGRPTPCVGRDTELATLEVQLGGCIEESEARVVLITAPPGMGKSRLRHEFLRRVRLRSEAVTVLLGRGDMLGSGLPYGMLGNAIRRLCGISGSEPPDEQQRRLRARIEQHLAAKELERIVLFIGELCNVPFPEAGRPLLQAARQEPKIMRDCLWRALLDWLAAECAAAPVLLLLDDLQWCDELTVSALHDGLREQSEAPLFVLAFARPEVNEIFPTLWNARNLQEMPLKALSKRACERLIQQVLGAGISPAAVNLAIEQSAGNALYLEELIRSLAEGKPEEQPDTIVAMLQSRIGRLDGGARRAIRAASIFQQTFWRSGVALILELPGAAAEVEHGLDELIKAELIEPHTASRLLGEKEYGFRHALVREAAYGLLTATDLAAGHRLAGEFLTSAADSDVAVIAGHFERAGDKPRAVDYYLRAAENSLKSGNCSGALQYVDRGLQCEPGEQSLALLRSVECYAAHMLDRYERAGAAAEVAIQSLRVGSLGWCRVIVGAIAVAIAGKDLAKGLALVSQLLVTQPEPEARAAYIEAVGLVSLVLVVSAPDSLMQVFVDRLTSSVDLAEEGNPTIRRYLHATRASMALLREPRPWSLLVECQCCQLLARDAGDRFLAVFMGELISQWSWLDLGDLQGTRLRLVALEAEVSRCQEVVVGVHWRHLLARVLCEFPDEGAWLQAEQLVATILMNPGGHALFPTLAKGILARVALLRGQLEKAQELAEALMQNFAAMPVWLTHTASVQMRTLTGLGRAPEAIAVAEQVLRALPDLGGAGLSEIEVRLAATESFHAAGDLERARTELGETLRKIQLRADNIPDPVWKDSYLTRNPYCARAQKLGREWNLGLVVGLTTVPHACLRDARHAIAARRSDACSACSPAALQVAWPPRRAGQSASGSAVGNAIRCVRPSKRGCQADHER